MSISKPQNREEYKQHILTKLGHPVLEVNVSDEQMDIAIDDSFQYFHERNHFNGVERIYLTIQLNNNVLRNYSSFGIEQVNQVPGNVRISDQNINIRRQNNYIILPDDIVGVEEIIRGRSGMGGIGGGGMLPGVGFPGMIGAITGDGCDNTGFGLTQYWAFQEYMALLQFTLFPPKMYNFNQRTHRLWIDGDLSDLRGMLCLQCMAKPNPDIFPDLWNDLWLKEMTTALIKAQWGRNLTKFQGVQLPGGITMNGERILDDAQKELQIIKDRFAMDWADPPLDQVG
jgi:hypothetical protein